MTSYLHPAHADATESSPRRPSQSGVWRARFAGRMPFTQNVAPHACASREGVAAPCTALVSRVAGQRSRGAPCAWRVGRCDDGRARGRYVADVRGDATAIRGGHWVYDEVACALRWATSGG